MWRIISSIFPRRNRRRKISESPEILRARQLLNAGKVTEARKICGSALTFKPGDPAAHNLLGGIALTVGEYAPAAQHFLKAAELDPYLPSCHQGLGIAYFNLGKFDDSVGSFQQAVELEPWNPVSHCDLGNCYLRGSKFNEAARCFEKAIAAKKTHLPAHFNLIEILIQQCNFKAAKKACRRAIRIAEKQPDNKESLTFLYEKHGTARMELEDYDNAIICFQKALSLSPISASINNSLGSVKLFQNELESSIEHYQKALQAEPDHPLVHSNILFVMNYLNRVTQEQIYEESIRFNDQFTKGLAKGRNAQCKLRNKNKVLRVGYVSSDFREHSVAYFTRELMGEHDRNAITVYCYSSVKTPDYLTAQFQAQADNWLDIARMTDAEAATRIRNDRIDILVDLTGHTKNNRLLIFAQKPAPIQLSWLGYPNTTGMSSIDYRLTDDVADPEGEADQFHTEKLIRLKTGFLCYQINESIPAATNPPCVKRGYITFGSFNTLQKLNPDVIRIWSQVLQSVPGSKLLLKSKALLDKTTRQNIFNSFEKHGIKSNRLKLAGRATRRNDHMMMYSQIDIALDPFPYNGTTTTCEALWMGVPVICLLGNRHAGRVSASIAHHIGLTELIADNEETYVRLAKELAGQEKQLISMRRTLRSLMLNSEFTDVPSFARTLEATYRDIWVKWCNKERKT